MLLVKMRRNCGAASDSIALRQPLVRIGLGDGGKLLGMDMDDTSSQVLAAGAFDFSSRYAYWTSRSLIRR